MIVPWGKIVRIDKSDDLSEINYVSSDEASSGCYLHIVYHSDYLRFHNSQGFSQESPRTAPTFTGSDVPGLSTPKYLAPSDVEIPVEDQPHAADGLTLYAISARLHCLFLIRSEVIQRGWFEGWSPSDYPADGVDVDDVSFGIDA
ncbi:hypothetical protein Tco_0446448 [Tanacetum coccineum]